MLSKFRKSEQGFTLIELLIVVAIIGILAAIAIPQFSAYRLRAYNSTALSDMRNTKSAEESLYAEIQAYGSTDGAATNLTAVAPAAAGVVNNGPMPAAIGGANPTAGARVAGTRFVVAGGANVSSAIPFGISNGVNIHAACSTDVATGTYNSYTVVARHEQGDTAYGADSDNTTTVYRVSNPNWIGVLNIISATVPAATNAQDDFNPAGVPATGGGLPTDTWILM